MALPPISNSVPSAPDSARAGNGSRPASNGRSPSFAFIGWNPFQFRQILGVARQLENSCLVIEKRADHIFHFDESILTESGRPVVIWSRKRVDRLDGLFDVIVCQTPFSQMETISRSKIAMMQYGYAKEEHNYGQWRSAAGLCLAYGDYAARKLSPLCPVEVTGNPIMDAWYTGEFHQAARARYGALLDPTKKTVLYAPTWGDLSTMDLYLDEVKSLASDFNVLLKLHHNTDMLDKPKRKGARSGVALSFGANDSLLDLFSISDIVLSDYSGAIFDALNCEKPVILLHSETTLRFGEKMGPGSLEYASRHRIGPVIEEHGILRKTVQEVFAGTLDFTQENRALTSELYLQGPGATQRAAAALMDFALR
ncbi:MAG: CDP-glycerol--glycerophosphate glycerophosphotransferase [Verrucomicrobiaceae bacterium]|nr:MAG: CDP-glycerol--glycerophosphate glycerophosphotransferase [Verrucomicrobiaceae bacterium]